MSVKICFISNYTYRLFNPKSRLAFGGIETIFFLIAKDLAADRRLAISFLLEDDLHNYPTTEKIDGIILYKTSRQMQSQVYKDEQIERYSRWFTYWARKFNCLWQWPHLDFFRLWEKLKQIQSDVYIFANPSYESSLLTLIIKIIRKKSIFIVVNDELLVKNYQSFFFLMRADVILCYLPRHQKILWQKYRIKAVYLPPWYHRPKKILSFDQRKHLLWVGRIEARKQPKVFVKLAKSFPETKFLMIIAASPNEQALFKSIIRSAVHVPNLTIKRDVVFAELDKYYQKALAFIDTSNYKNLNMSQVQAAYFKTPGLSYFYDPNDSYKNYQWGLSAAANFKQMIQNIKLLFSRPKLWQRLSGKAYEFANSVYNPEANLSTFKKLIFKLSR